MSNVLRGQSSALRFTLKPENGHWSSGWALSKWFRSIRGYLFDRAGFHCRWCLFCPIAFRAQTYSLPLGIKSQNYINKLPALPAMKEWYNSAISETHRDLAHEQGLELYGNVVSDFRRKADWHSNYHGHIFNTATLIISAVSDKVSRRELSFSVNNWIWAFSLYFRILFCRGFFDNNRVRTLFYSPRSCNSSSIAPRCSNMASRLSSNVWSTEAFKVNGPNSNAVLQIVIDKLGAKFATPAA